MWRVMHVGLGPLGQRVAEDLHRRGLGEVVVAVDPAWKGHTLADVVPVPGTSTVLGSVDEWADWGGLDAAIVTTTSSLEACAQTFTALLTRGVSVISTCEELSYPWLRHPALAGELDAIARAHGGRLLGTGINPGFLMDAFAVMTSAVCTHVRSVSVRRVQDATSRRLPFQKKIGVGLSPDAFAAKVADGSLRHVGLGESLHFIAHALGWELDGWEEDVRPVLAEERVETALGVVPAGHCRGVLQVARGFVGDDERLELDFVAAVGEPDPHDRVVLEATPPVDLVWRGGVHGDVGTSAVVLNALGSLLRAAPGLHTMATIPLVGHVARPSRAAHLVAGVAPEPSRT